MDYDGYSGGGFYMSVTNGNSESMRRSMSWNAGTGSHLRLREPLAPYAINYGAQNYKPSARKCIYGKVY